MTNLAPCRHCTYTHRQDKPSGVC